MKILTYRTATSVLELGTSFTVGIAPADGEVIETFPFELMDGGEYVVVATGLLGNTDTPFDLQQHQQHLVQQKVMLV